MYFFLPAHLLVLTTVIHIVNNFCFSTNFTHNQHVIPSIFILTVTSPLPPLFRLLPAQCRPDILWASGRGLRIIAALLCALPPGQLL